jgi:2-octaprenyl-6-methoxyphenol hydroxylase
MSKDSLSSIQQNHYDLAIVGGGIVGTTLASALKNSGLKIAIIETQTLDQAVARRQAYALNLLSGKIFEQIGVWADIFPKIEKFRKIRLSDADYDQIVKFSPQDLETEFLGYVGEHNAILQALQDFLAKCPNITWLCPAEVVDFTIEDSGVAIQLQQEGKTHQITSKLIVGADGARSPIRQKAGIKTNGWKYWQSCVAFTIKHQAPDNDSAFERFWPTGPMGVLPLPENRCQIVWTFPHAEAKAMQQLEESEFVTQVEYHTGGSFGKISLISDRQVFPVQLMQCDRYIQHRLALVGDAAHCCHPVGGQGLNLGIRDAASLAQILTEAIKKNEDIGAISTLKPYEKWRKKENIVILGFTDFLNRTFSNLWFPLVMIRRFGLWMMNYISPLKIYALKLMTGSLVYSAYKL